MGVGCGAVDREPTRGSSRAGRSSPAPRSLGSLGAAIAAGARRAAAALRPMERGNRAPREPVLRDRVRSDAFAADKARRGVRGPAEREEEREQRHVMAPYITCETPEHSSPFGLEDTRTTNRSTRGRRWRTDWRAAAGNRTVSQVCPFYEGVTPPSNGGGHPAVGERPVTRAPSSASRCLLWRFGLASSPAA